MKKVFNYILSGSLILGVASCSEDEVLADWIEDNPVIAPVTGDPGNLDLTNYVAIGNSLTAGFADGALYPEGQANSFASILASRFALAGGGSFNYPNISSGNGFGGVNADMSFRGKSFISVADALVNPANAIQFTGGAALSANTVQNLNNFGVPGARIIDAVTAGYGNLNPYFGTFQSSGTTSMLADAMGANATFFSVWLGSNDVLGYAIGGGTETDGDNIEGNQDDPTQPSLLTSVANFSGALTGVLDGLSANGAKGVIVNLPPVTLAPFFQIVTQLSGGVNLIPMDAATAGAVNSAYNDPATGYNPGLSAAVAIGAMTQEEANRRTINFSEGTNPPVITDESLTQADISAAFGFPAGSVVLPNLRHAEATDLFPLTALAVVGTLADPTNPASVYGVGVPVPDQNTLTLAEQGAIIQRYATFNALIAAEAAARNNIEMVDVGPMFADVFGLVSAQAAGLALSAEAQASADGVLGTTVGGFNLVPLSLGDDLFNSIWSSDGIHPNARGAAIVANEIIKVINANFDASIIEADPLTYTSINAVL